MAKNNDANNNFKHDTGAFVAHLLQQILAPQVSVNNKQNKA